MGASLAGSLTGEGGPVRQRTAHSQIHLEVQQNSGLGNVGDQTVFGVE